MACDFTAGRTPLPGGTIHRGAHWVVEHCVGPLGLGALIVKPERHVIAVADLSDAEAAELGPLLRDASIVARDLMGAEQVHHGLWSHAGGVPGHVHYVVQPVTAGQVATAGVYGPALQMEMFDRGIVPAPADVERVAGRAREAFAAMSR